MWTTLGEISNYGQCENVDVDKIAANEWILELEDIEKDSGHIIQKLCKDDRKACGTRHKFYRNEILYSKLRTYLNKVLVAPSSGFCTSEIIPIHCIETNPWFICFVLRSNYFLDYTASLGYGVKMPRLGTNDALISYIPLPPLSEQARIVDEVAKWNIIIDEIEDDKLELEAYVKKTKSKILDLAISGKLVPQDPNDEPAIELLKRINPGFEPCDNSHYENLPFEVPDGWCWAKINDVTEFIKNGAQIKQFKGASGIPITRIETISNSELDMARMGYANITNGAEYKDYYIKDGDILMSHINSRAHIGKCALCNVGENQIIHGMNLLRIRCSKQILPEYMVYYFRSTTFYNLIEPHIKNAVNQASINITNLQKILIPIPPYSEQRRVAFIVDKLFSTIDTITAEL